MMKNNKTTCLLFCLAALTLVSCNRQYHIDGTIDIYGCEGQRLDMIVYKNGHFTSIDSCYVRHGKFAMEGRIDSTMLAVLFNGQEVLMPMFIEPGKITINLNTADVSAWGTRQNNLLYEFMKKKKALDNRYEELVQSTTPQFGFWGGGFVDFDRVNDSIQVVLQQTEEYYYEFISRHYKEPVGVSVFTMSCDALSYPQVTPLVKRVLDNAPKIFLEHPYVQHFIEESGYKRE